MPKYLISSGIPNYPAGLVDEDAALVTPLYLATNNLAQAISQHTGNVQYDASDLSSINQLAPLTNHLQNKVIVKATEAIGYGKLINLHIDGGKLAARLATHAAAAPLAAMAILDSSQGLAAGQYGLAILIQGLSLGVSGSILGQQYYLGLAGIADASPPVGAGKLLQHIGLGLGSAGFYLNIPTQGYLL